MSTGDYGVFSKYLEKGALEFFDRLNIPPGHSIPRCRVRSWPVVQQARAKAAEEGLRIHVDEGDAENLPYPDASFDVVMSLIGSMFAPRPELARFRLLCW